jgi:hypothetical protein
MDASGPLREAVAYESDVSDGVELIKYDLV